MLGEPFGLQLLSTSGECITSSTADAAQSVLQAWIAHTSDPLIGPDAQDVIAAIASQPACLPSLAAAAAPTLAGILSRGAAARQAKRQGLPPPAAEPGQDGPMLVEASLDLLGTLVNPGQEAVAAEVGFILAMYFYVTSAFCFCHLGSKSCTKHEQ